MYLMEEAKYSGVSLLEEGKDREVVDASDVVPGLFCGSMKLFVESKTLKQHVEIVNNIEE